MTFYLDTDFKLHTTQIENTTPVELTIFDGKCTEYIEGHRYVPEGSVWVREDGEKFFGPMCVAWKPYSELDAAQREYERQLIADMQEALAETDAAEAAYKEGVQNA